MSQGFAKPPHEQFSPEWTIAHHGELYGKAGQFLTILGYRRQWRSTSAQGDVCAYLVGGQDKFNTPAVGTTYYVNSTSVQDLTAGTGVDRVRISYLDASGNSQVVDASLNGTTAVSIGTGFSFIQGTESWHSTTADREAAGDITISSINGVATEATTMEMIRAGGNRSQSLRYKVPTGYHAHLIDGNVSSVKLGGGAATDHTFNFRGLVFNDINDGLATSYHFLKGASISDGGNWSDDFHYKEIPAGGIIKLSNIPTATADGNIVQASLDFFIVAD